MQITVGNAITIRSPTDEIKKWCKSNLIIPNPDYAKKLRMHRCATVAPVCRLPTGGRMNTGLPA